MLLPDCTNWTDLFFQLFHNQCLDKRLCLGLAAKYMVTVQMTVVEKEGGREGGREGR